MEHWAKGRPKRGGGTCADRTGTRDFSKEDSGQPGQRYSLLLSTELVRPALTSAPGRERRMKTLNLIELSTKMFEKMT